MNSDPAVVKAQSFLSRLIDYSNPLNGTSLIYKNVENDVVLMSRIFLSLPGNGNPLATDDPKQALDDLIGFGTISGPDEMAKAVDSITRAFSAYLTDEKQKFIALVGEGTITDSSIPSIFETRRNQEVDEQNLLLAKATDLKTKLEAVASSLSVPLSSAPVPDPKLKDNKQKLNLFERLLMVPDPKVSSKLSNLSSGASWETSPILDESVNADIDKFMRIWSYLFERKIDPKVVKESLAQNYGLDETKITELVGLVYSFVLKQITQSQEAMTSIEKDYKLYQGCLYAALELQSMLVDVGKFFGFTVGKISPSVAKSKQ